MNLNALALHPRRYRDMTSSMQRHFDVDICSDPDLHRTLSVTSIVELAGEVYSGWHNCLAGIRTRS